MKKFFLTLFVVCFLVLQCVFANNLVIYEPYLNDTAPTIVETVDEYTSNGVYVHKLKFLNRHADGQDTIIYGILAKPDGAGPYPGVLCVHGGGGSADQMFPQVEDWAKLGYVSFCQDQPGMGRSFDGTSSGPYVTRDLLDVHPDATYSSLYDGVLAGLNGLRMIRSQPETDVNNVGITGGSWGGYMTTMISGLSQDRIKASFAIYGCGYWDIGSYWTPKIESISAADQVTWLSAFDAGRKASQIASNFFLNSPTNDWYFWPGAMMATYNDISSAKNMAIAANADHYLDYAGGTSSTQKGVHRTYMEIQWMNYHLKGIGDPFGACTANPVVMREGESVRVRFTYTGVNPAEGVGIYYSYGETPFRSNYWRSVPVTNEGGGTYSALIDVYETELPLFWYGVVQDYLGGDGREYTVSTTYQTINPGELGFIPQERRNESLTEDFEGVTTRWKRVAEESYPGTFNITTSAARSGNKGLYLSGEYQLRCNGLRGEAYKQFADGFKMWVKNVGGTDFNIKLRAEEPNGIGHYWTVHQAYTGPDWNEIEVKFDDFVYDGSGQPPVEMLSNHLSKMIISTPAGSLLYIDDVSTIVRNFIMAWDPEPVSNTNDLSPTSVKTLSWTPGDYTDASQGHDVYLGTSEAAVYNATTSSDEYRGRYDSNSYYVGALDFDWEQTYYWRIDEVNSPYVYKGRVWNFTMESADIATNGIMADAKYWHHENYNPIRTVNGSGMDETGLLSMFVDGSGWCDAHYGDGLNPHPGTVAGPTWIGYDLGRVYTIGEMWVWNRSTTRDTSLGFRNVTIEYSQTGGSDPAEWKTAWFGEFNRSTGSDNYPHETEVNFGDGGIEARYIVITPDSVNGTWGGSSYIGLAEVRFFKTMPTVKANHPKPADAVVDVSVDVTLQWSSGYLASSHDVYFGTSFDDVNDASRLKGDIDGNGLVDMVDLSLLCGRWLNNSPDFSEVQADIEEDGNIDFFDFAGQADSWALPCPAVFKGNQFLGVESYNLNNLSAGQTYYWRVDEVNGPDTWKGDVWSFTVN